MAACYVYHIAQNQPFVDGNKRTAVAAALCFLHVNGYALRTEAGPELERLVLAIAEHAAGKRELEALLAEHVADVGFHPMGWW